MSSDSLPSAAKTVITGGGIVGNSLAYHLARMGREDIAILDKEKYRDIDTFTNSGGIGVARIEERVEVTSTERTGLQVAGRCGLADSPHSSTT